MLPNNKVSKFIVSNAWRKMYKKRFQVSIIENKRCSIKLNNKDMFNIKLE